MDPSYRPCILAVADSAWEVVVLSLSARRNALPSRYLSSAWGAAVISVAFTRTIKRADVLPLVCYLWPVVRRPPFAFR